MTLTYTAGGVADVTVATQTGTAPAQTGTGSATVSSATYTAGALLTVAVCGNGPGDQVTASPTWHVTSVVCTGLTFSKVISNEADISRSYPTAEVWSAVVPGGGVTGAITVNMGGASDGSLPVSSDAGTVAVSQWTDVGTPSVGVTGSNSSSSPSMALTGLTVGSYVLACSGDFNSAYSAVTYGSGISQVQYVYNNPYYAAYVYKTTAAITGTTQTMSITAPTGMAANSVAVEIKSATAVPASATGMLSFGTSVTPKAATAVTGTVTFAGTATPKATAPAVTGSMTFAGTPAVARIATGVLSFAGVSTATVGPGVGLGLLTFSSSGPVAAFTPYTSQGISVVTLTSNGSGGFTVL